MARSPALTPLDAGADLEHLAHRRVPEDRRRDLPELAAPVDDVRGAERRRAGRAASTRAGRGVEVGDVLDDERRVELGEERGSHPPRAPAAGSGPERVGGAGAAVDRVEATGHVRRLVAEQEGDERGDLLGRARPARAASSPARARGAASLFTGAPPGWLIRLVGMIPGAIAFTRTPSGRAVDRAAAGEAEHGVLRDVVRDDVGGPEHARERRRSSTIAPPLPCRSYCRNASRSPRKTPRTLIAITSSNSCASISGIGTGVPAMPAFRWYRSIRPNRSTAASM